MQHPAAAQAATPAAPSQANGAAYAPPSSGDAKLSSLNFSQPPIGRPIISTQIVAPPSAPATIAAPVEAPAVPRAETDSATSRPVLAPRETQTRQSPAPSPRAQVGVVVALLRQPDADTLVAAEANTTTAYSAVKADQNAASSPTPAGVHLVESPLGSAYGRLCNAGYRHLKKMNPDLRFVQFLEAGAKLDPQWIDAALRFMERRPEVAVVEGRAEAPPLAPLSATVTPPPGEAQTVGKTFLVRAEAFEAAGGFRGDLLVNETADLCIRMRRRGAHVWRIDDRMCVRPAVDRRSWWKDAVAAGYAFAHGVKLHGAQPEQLYVREHIRSLAWGAAVPVFIAALSVGVTLFAIMNGTLVDGLVALAASLALGLFIYGARVAVIAAREGVAKRASWAYGTRVVLGQFGEFLGACRFYLSGTDPRRSAA